MNDTGVPNPHRLVVNETFRSVQGEGPSAGQTAAFLRLANCNLKCTWCDTPYSWDWATHDRSDNTERLTTTAAADRMHDLIAGTARLAVITGGEPMLQQQAILQTLRLINQITPEVRFEIETNGTVPPSPELSNSVDRYVVSPKLANAGGSAASRIRLDALRAYADHPGTHLKFVVQGPEDFPELLALVDALKLAHERVWIMPEGRDRDTVLTVSQRVARHVIEHGLNLSSRLHILLWGDEPGR